MRPRLSVDASAPELLLSPHWDDAALSCWSLLGRPGELNVVNVFAGIPTAGEPGTWELVLGVADRAERARRRMAEDERALAGAGRSPVNLSLLDAGYEQGRRRDDSLRALDGELCAVVPRASRVYAPAGIGGNRDHQLTRRYARMLLHAGMPVALYAEAPYCLLHGWPSWVDGREPAPSRDVDAYWLSFLGRVPELPPLRSALVERLDERAARAKGEAVQGYEASLSYGFRRMLADPELLGFEVRWELQHPADTLSTHDPSR
ncbi:MAG TPA: PIG-L family deacetylase [Solirubrobacteraceae bacterium]|jgi:hypothetical protein|nr:PIG-L family deacetylase [Solirubrobacteraceae bacterium]